MDFNTFIPPKLKCLDNRHKDQFISKVILKNETNEDQKIFESKSRMACSQCMESTMKQYRGFAADYKQLFRHWTKILESTQFENNPLQHLSHYIKEMEPDVGESEVQTKISEIRNKITLLIDSIRDELLRKVQQKEEFLKSIQNEIFFDNITKSFNLQVLNQKFGELSEKFNITDASATKKVNELITQYLINPIQKLNADKESVEGLEKKIRDQQKISVNYQKFDYLEYELPEFLNQYKSVLNEDYLTKFSYIATDYIEELFPLEAKEKLIEQYREKIYGIDYTESKQKQNYYQQLLGVKPFFRSGQGKLGFDNLKTNMLKLDGQQKILFLFKTNERKIGLYYHPTNLKESFLFDMNNRRKYTNYQKNLYVLDDKGLTFGKALQITHDFKKCRSELELKDGANQNQTSDIILTGENEFIIQEMEIFIVNNLLQEQEKQQDSQKTNNPQNKQVPGQTTQGFPTQSFPTQNFPPQTFPQTTQTINRQQPQVPGAGQQPPNIPYSVQK